LGVLAAAAALFYYLDRLAANVAWDREVAVEQETRLNATLFKIAVARGLIASQPRRSGELFLSPPPCEGLILKDPLKIYGARNAEYSASDERDYRIALRLLCNSPQGEEIRSEIEAWNAIYDMLGVRDNRFQNEKCESGREGLSAEIFVPRNCKPNSWKVERLLQGGSATASWIPAAEPPPADFSMIADPDRAFAFYGDWAVLRSGEGEDANRPKYRMSSGEITLDKEVTIDVVGRLRRVKVYASSLDPAQADKAPVHVVDPTRPETRASGIPLGPAQVQIFLHCGQESEFEANLGLDDEEEEGEGEDKKTRDQQCDAEPSDNSRIPIAYQITLGKAPRNSGARVSVRVELEAEPVQMLPAALRKDWRKIEEKSPAFAKQLSLRLTRHITARCAPNFREREGICELSWERIPGVQRSNPPEIAIVLDAERDRNLVDAETGNIQTKAFEEGLSPVIGLGPQDWGSLAYAVAHRKQASGGKPMEPVRLTINPLMQAVARSAIESGVQTDGCQAPKRTKKGRAPQARPRDCVVLRDEQTATLVVVDADKKAGEIQALAAWPKLARNLHIWDVQALESAGADMSAGFWRLVVPDQRPGSTFKAVTAMTAIDMATGPPERTSPQFTDGLREILSGDMPLLRQVEFLRLAGARWVSMQDSRSRKRCVIEAAIAPNAIPVPNSTSPQWCAHNYQAAGKGPIDYWQPSRPGQTACDPGLKAGALAHFGMCEAIKVSSNLFFGGLSEQMTRRGPKRDDDRLAMDVIARRLSFDYQPCRDSEGREVVDQSGKVSSCGFDLLRGMAGRAAKLRADPIHLDLPSVAKAFSDVPQLIRTGWGDGAAATPLAIASIYASLGRRRLVRPSIVPIDRRPDGCPLRPEQSECDDLLPDWPRATKLFETLRAGFHAVGEPEGSAATAFAGSSLLRMPGKAEPRLFVKTGTATYRATNEKTGKSANYFSLWLAGWIEGIENTPIPQRLAFACLITRGINNDTGGGTCARLVRRFLDRLNQTSAVR
jgi:cell division protein FtsI/penicillin-binding protein 2